ncbi:MAG: hypothetical protein LW635_05945 [Microcystis sp. 53598_E5]|nr:hypothetical protein [Microcystis sp. 53598_E5]
MARISIVNLQSDDRESSLIHLEESRISLIKVAVEGALDTRRIIAGMKFSGFLMTED